MYTPFLKFRSPKLPAFSYSLVKMSQLNILKGSCKGPNNLSQFRDQGQLGRKD